MTSIDAHVLCFVSLIREAGGLPTKLVRGMCPSLQEAFEDLPSHKQRTMRDAQEMKSDE